MSIILFIAILFLLPANFYCVAARFSGSWRWLGVLIKISSFIAFVLMFANMIVHFKLV